MYFTEEDIVDFIPSGSTLLDCALGGGWARGRVCNIVGDKSTGKSLLTVQAVGHNLVSYPKSFNKYVDAEHVDVIEYFKQIGAPHESVQFEEEVFTVEDFYNTLETFESEVTDEQSIYILDSLDALSNKAEMEAKITDGSYGMGLPKKMSELFRKLNAKVAKKNITLMVVSQIRDNIVTFGHGPKFKRSGGHAMDFYASQVVWLETPKPIKRTIAGEERAIGVEINAFVDKNKVSLPWRECKMKIVFEMGVDDIWSNLEYLYKKEALDRVEELKGEKLATDISITKFAREAQGWNFIERDKLAKGLSIVTRQVYEEIESKFKVPAKNFA
ncbi:MAG TPA: ATPase domain-containing protein [Nitrosopumilaceae archaeon]|jgi:recombination protein RecA|nr:ATPase domain-containing protein [Nitrosopumilaceae archaeon]